MITSYVTVTPVTRYVIPTLPAMTRFSHLDRIPQEILEHIAFQVAESDFLGPPSGIVPLICLNRYTYTSLGSNNHLYARIFAAKFDTAAAERRLGPKRISPGVLALELQRRCLYLKRLRAQVDVRFGQGSDEEDLLLHVYLMMLENDGKNESQLREYGKIESWLRIYWFDEAGSSLASLHLQNNKWPVNDTKLSVAMWLLWFFLRLGLFCFFVREIFVKAIDKIMCTMRIPCCDSCKPLLCRHIRYMFIFAHPTTDLTANC